MAHAHRFTGGSFRALLPKCLGVALVLAASAPLAAAAQTSVNPAAAECTGARRQLQLLPILFRTPDTGFAVGVLPQYIFRRNPCDRPSSVRLDAYYTQKKQYTIRARGSIWLSENRTNLEGKVAIRRWPNTFYGVGSSSADTTSEKFTERFAEVEVAAHRRVAPRVFVGSQYVLRSSDVTEVDSSGVLVSGVVPGSNGGNASGAGLTVTWDSRDNLYYPTQGSYHRASATVFPTILGSDFQFTRLRLDLRWYASLAVHQVLAVQTVLAANYGTSPFQLLNSVGTVIRGYTETRHIDEKLAAIQFEYRFVPATWRVGFALFGGVGQVADNLGSMDLDDVKYAFGLGARFQFSSTESINIRWDFAFGRDSSGDYLDLNEAF